MKDKDVVFMREAIELAKKRKGFTHPNPTVGAVLVKNGKIIGKGYHFKAGYPHAEREAIKDALSRGENIEGSTMYVTLEPCCHYGKTPPCTEAIIDNQIKRVVIATLDPNPLVAGNGVKILQKAGIDVKIGVLEGKAKRLNEDFFIFIKQKRPFVHLKVAQTLDGKIATKTGSSKWITNQKSREFAHILRNEATAVLVGKDTVLKDNPELTVRHIKTDKQPIRVVLDKNLNIPLNFKIFNDKAKTLVLTSNLADKNKLKSLKSNKNVYVEFLPLNKDGNFNVRNILDVLYKRGIVHLLVEGGRFTITEFIKSNLYDKISLFIAPKIIGSDGISSIGSLKIDNINESLNLKIDNIKELEGDIYLELYPT